MLEMEKNAIGERPQCRNHHIHKIHRDIAGWLLFGQKLIGFSLLEFCDDWISATTNMKGKHRRRLTNKHKGDFTLNFIGCPSFVLSTSVMHSLYCRSRCHRLCWSSKATSKKTLEVNNKWKITCIYLSMLEACVFEINEVEIFSYNNISETFSSSQPGNSSRIEKRISPNSKTLSFSLQISLSLAPKNALEKGKNKIKRERNEIFCCVCPKIFHPTFINNDDVGAEKNEEKNQREINKRKGKMWKEKRFSTSSYLNCFKYEI